MPAAATATTPAAMASARRARVGGVLAGVVVAVALVAVPAAKGRAPVDVRGRVVAGALSSYGSPSSAAAKAAPR